MISALLHSSWWGGSNARPDAKCQMSSDIKTKFKTKNNLTKVNLNPNIRLSGWLAVTPPTLNNSVSRNHLEKDSQ